MKKILFALCLMLAIGTMNAQTSGLVNLKSTTTTKTKDTVTNAGTRIQRLLIKGRNELTAQVTITKISGTVGGSVGLYGSVDNVGYTLIGSAQTPTDVATQTLSFNVNPYAGTAPGTYQYYQINYTGTGTMAASFMTPVLYRTID